MVILGFSYKECWDVIKGDLMAAVNYFFLQHDQHFKHLNSAHIILIPKKSDATCVGDYRPISLTHSVAKLISKLLANRLSVHLDELVSRAQVHSSRSEASMTTFCSLRTLCVICSSQNIRRSFSSWTLPQVGHCKGLRQCEVGLPTGGDTNGVWCMVEIMGVNSPWILHICGFP